MLQSSNPILAADDAFGAFYGDDMAAARPATASVQGVVNKTAILAAICAGGGVVGYSIAGFLPGVTWIAAIAAFVIVLGVGFFLRGNPMAAGKVAWLYALVEGVFLGALTSGLDSMLHQMYPNLAGLSLALPAFVVTMAVMASVLGLYRAGIIKPTRGFQAFMAVAVGGIMLTYLASFVLSFFGIAVPFINIGSAMQGGTAALIGLGLNVLILGIAGLTLVMDFAVVDEIVDSGAPRQMEWYAAFGLIVSLAWIYFEAVKLCFRVAVLLGNRE